MGCGENLFSKKFYPPKNSPPKIKTERIIVGGVIVTKKSVKKTAILLALLMCASAAAGCKKKPAEVSDGSGIERIPLQSSDENVPPSGNNDDEDKKDETNDKDDKTNPADDGKLWSVEDGKYTYNFPARDRHAKINTSDIASLFGTEFDDQPDDWYFGKSTYDEATGNVTVAWDRYQSTIDKVAQYGAIYRGDTTRKVCYFTFDCGYEFGPTASILDTLKEKQVPGIFFLTGDYVESEDALIKRMLDEGHIVGNHTVNHLRANTLSADAFIAELEGVEYMFYEKFPDADPMIFFRPPYGNCNEYVLALAQKMGYHTVMWSYTYMDYDTNNQLPHDQALAKLKSGLHPGAVYLFHTESTTNAAVLGDFIDWVREQGYEILPVCDIIQNAQNSAGNGEN